MNKQHQQDWKELNEWLCEPDGTEKDFCSTSDLWFGASLAFALRRILDRIRELEQQQDAALKLAEELRNACAHTYASENADLYRGFDNGCSHAAKKIEAIFTPKERK